MFGAKIYGKHTFNKVKNYGGHLPNTFFYFSKFMAILDLEWFF